MYPLWIQDIVRCCPYAKCASPTTVDDIEQIGVRRPEEWQAWAGEPLVVVTLACRNCGHLTNAMERTPLAAALDAITAFAATVEHESQGKEPPLKIPGLRKPAPSATAPAAPTARDNPGPLRPSRRRGQPVTPPSEKEIRAFLNRLRLTPFKRGSKGFKKWMKDFGAELDANDTNADQP